MDFRKPRIVNQNVIYSLNPDLAHDLDFTRSLDRSLDDDIELKLGIVARLDWQLLISNQISTWIANFGNELDLPPKWLNDYAKWHESLIEVTQKIQQPTLSQTLQLIVLPQSLKHKSQWRLLSDTFTKLMRTERSWPTDLEWTNEALDTLDRYFRANQLYLDCLAVASVSDREKFKNLAIPLPNL